MRLARRVALGLALLVGCLGHGADGALAQVSGSGSAMHGVSAELTAIPLEVEIGQPIEWRLVVRHPAEVKIIVPTETPVPDDSWVLVEKARRSSRNVGTGERETLVRWDVISLDPGERALPSVPVEFDAGGVPQRIASTAGTVAVRAALAEGEDAPRPPVGFRPPPDEPETLPLWPLWTIFGVLLGGLISLLVLRLRGRPQARRVRPAPATRLTALEARRGDVGDEPQAIRGLYYELSSLVREAVDRRAAMRRDEATGNAEPATSALTDEEWLEHLKSNQTALPAEIPATVEDLLRKAEAVKYGQGAPTRFAVDEVFADARRVVETLERAPEPQTGEAS